MTLLTRASRLRARLAESQFGTVFAGSAAWSVLASICSSGVMLILLFLVTRWLGPAIAGRFVIFQTTTLAAISIGAWGIATALTREVALSIDISPHRLPGIVRCGEIIAVGIGSAGALMIFLFAPFIAVRLLDMPETTPLLRLAGVAVLAASVDTAYKGVLTGQGRFGAIAAATIAGAAAATTVTVPLMHYFGVLGAASGVCVSWLVQMTVSGICVYRELDRRSTIPVEFKAESLRLLAIAAPATVAGASVAPAHWIVQTILIAQPGGAVQLAVVGICMQWFNALTLVPMSIGKIAMPVVARSLASSRISQARDMLRYSVFTNAILVVPVAVSVGLSSEFLLSVYDPQLAANIWPMLIAMLCACVTAIQFPYASVIWANAKAWRAAAANVAWGAAFVTTALWLMDRGALGVMAALLAAYTLNLMLLLAMTRRLTLG